MQDDLFAPATVPAATPPGSPAPQASPPVRARNTNGETGHDSAQSALLGLGFPEPDADIGADTDADTDADADADHGADQAAASPTSPQKIPRAQRGAALRLAPLGAEMPALAAALPPQLHLGVSSWSYPGWQGLVWEGLHSEQKLAKDGLRVLAQHPLVRTVSIDRGFYRPLTLSQYQTYAAQVPDDFRFIVKAPSLVTDALVRADDGRGRQANTAFLDAALACSEFVQPALLGLGHKLGALVFQISPLPWQQLERLPEVLERLRTMLAAQPALAPLAPEGVLAVEVRDPEWLTPQFADVLRSTGATYCLGLHAKMPPLAEQLPLLRALWPGPLVCRWNLNPALGPYGYADAEQRYQPYDRIHDPDPATHAELARLAQAFTGAGQKAYIAISNHAEGCAPRTLHTLAERIAALRQANCQA